eukprot:121796-Hanusia_phi.AAC.1
MTRATTEEQKETAILNGNLNSANAAALPSQPTAILSAARGRTQTVLHRADAAAPAAVHPTRPHDPTRLVRRGGRRHHVRYP